MSKIHFKNGFEYYCSSFAWRVDWYFRPVGDASFIPVNCGELKTCKKDVEELLSSHVKASQYYNQKLLELSDLESAYTALSEALEKCNKVSAPNFGGTGSNPNRDERARKNADRDFIRAETRVKTAEYYSDILKKQKNRVATNPQKQ